MKNSGFQKLGVFLVGKHKDILTSKSYFFLPGKHKQAVMNSWTGILLLNSYFSYATLLVGERSVEVETHL